MEFPPPGTRWITRTTDRPGRHVPRHLHRARARRVPGPGRLPRLRRVGVQFFERAGRNWFATVVREKERTGSTPHSGTFAWPLEVGKTWTSVYQFRDNQRNLRFNRVDDHVARGRRGGGDRPRGPLQDPPPRGREQRQQVDHLVRARDPARGQGDPRAQARPPVRARRAPSPRWSATPGRAAIPGTASGSRPARRRCGGARGGARWPSTRARRRTSRPAGCRSRPRRRCVEAARIARSIGAAQPGIRAGLRAIELLKAAPRNDVVLGDLANAYMFTGVALPLRGQRAPRRSSSTRRARSSRPRSPARPQRQLFWAGVSRARWRASPTRRRDFAGRGPAGKRRR